MEFRVPQNLPGMNIDTFLSSPEERKWSGPFTFVLGADPQFGMIRACKLRKSGPNWNAEMQLSREAIQKINKMTPKPKFFLVCGDMLDATPFDNKFCYYNGKDSHYRDLQYTDFCQVFQKLDPEIKLVCACGNHDIGDVPTEQSVERYRNEFGPDYFSFWVGGVKFVVLNSQYFYSPHAIRKESEKHLKFIQSIHDSSAKFIVVFQHIPFFGNDADEDDMYSNIRKDIRLPMLETLWKSGVRYMFCGHYHKNCGGFYKDLEQVVTSAMGAPWGEDASGFRVVSVTLDGLAHEYISLRDTTDCKEFDEEFGTNIIGEAEIQCEQQNFEI